MAKNKQTNEQNQKNKPKNTPPTKKNEPNKKSIFIQFCLNLFQCHESLKQSHFEGTWLHILFATISISNCCTNCFHLSFKRGQARFFLRLTFCRSFICFHFLGFILGGWELEPNFSVLMETWCWRFENGVVGCKTSS